MKKVLRKTLGLIRLPRMYDLPLIFYCVVLSLIGVVFIGSATITSDDAVVREVLSSVIKQLIFLFVSLVGMILASNIYSDALFKKLKSVIVVGAGFIGLEVAEKDGSFFLCRDRRSVFSRRNSQRSPWYCWWLFPCATVPRIRRSGIW